MKNLVALYHELIAEFKEDKEREERENLASYESDVEYRDRDYDYDHYFGYLDPEEQYWKDVEDGLFDYHDYEPFLETLEDIRAELSSHCEWEID